MSFKKQGDVIQLEAIDYGKSMIMGDSTFWKVKGKGSVVLKRLTKGVDP